MTLKDVLGSIDFVNKKYDEFNIMIFENPGDFIRTKEQFENHNESIIVRIFNSKIDTHPCWFDFKTEHLNLQLKEIMLLTDSDITNYNEGYYNINVLFELLTPFYRDHKIDQFLND